MLLFLSALLAAAPTTDPQLTASLTTLGTGTIFNGGATTDVSFAPTVSALGGPGHLLLDGALAAVVPITPGMSTGAATTLRIGGKWEYVWFSLGINARADATRMAAVQVLPSFAVQGRWRDFALRVALLDEPVGPLARISLSYRGIGVGYLAPLGAEADGDALQ